MGGLLHLVQGGGDWAAPGQAPPRCTKCNSPPINGQCTNHRIAVVYNGPLLCGFNVPIIGLKTKFIAFSQFTRLEFKIFNVAMRSSIH